MYYFGTLSGCDNCDKCDIKIRKCHIPNKYGYECKYYRGLKGASSAVSKIDDGGHSLQQDFLSLRIASFSEQLVKRGH